MNSIRALRQALCPRLRFICQRRLQNAASPDIHRILFQYIVCSNIPLGITHVMGHKPTQGPRAIRSVLRESGPCLSYQAWLPVLTGDCDMEFAAHPQQEARQSTCHLFNSTVKLINVPFFSTNVCHCNVNFLTCPGTAVLIHHVTCST